MTLKRLVARDLSFDGVRVEFALPTEFGPDAQRDAARAVDRHHAERIDRTDLELVTIDPPGSRDLDQAVHLERTDDGYLLHYAIADVAAQIEPGSALDGEARKRGETIYLPDGSVPLHPLVFSEGSASLLPNEIRPAALWRIATDGETNPVSWSVQRALVKSIRQLTYREAQDAADAGDPHPSIAALPEFGRKRRDLGLARGAIELNLPEQEVVRGSSGDWELGIEARTETDGWNAQISLLTGICAAQIMLDGGIGIGILRTLPPADGDVRRWIRRTADALGLPWASDTPIGAQLAALDPCATTTLAMMTQATTLLRGASYLVFDGERPDDQAAGHAGIAAPYAHVTAPLRRLGDRFATEICLALSAGTPVPQWARDGLAGVRSSLLTSNALANKVEQACVDLTEATVLAPQKGQTFDSAVLRGAEKKRAAEVFVTDPPILARCEGNPPEGQRAKLTLHEANPDTRTVLFGFPAEGS
ncbi:RNB domain-containing ribonuclease [Mycobacteroides salmoniphilum]|uniref:RNB domain-containing ribonuclease n=1 Tax=Mycobacteroides salmoniphilum TaxID=404941 RepID=UPI00099325A6|nr:RNB domain-containing ribonuclease [Mycobacteroides salmoniphilum]